MTIAIELTLSLTDQRLVPDFLIRMGIRSLVRGRLHSLAIDNCEARSNLIESFIREMNAGPVALVPEKANEQHYEVPAAFFTEVLGSHRKYSSCYWPEGIRSLDEAEAISLAQTCVHAELIDGQKILELGCGWGSLTLWMASHYPASTITGVSNSQSQRRFIEAEAARRGLDNIRIITADMNQFKILNQFDRVVSVEMFEHMRNYRELMRRIHGWLVPGGKFFMHIFCHRDTPYEFVAKDASDWMSRYFFSGGIMPYDDLPLHFQSDLKFLKRWRWDGTHYARTAEAWLKNMDARQQTIWPILNETYGVDQAGIWWERWRIFFMSCAELFGHKKGQQWWVSHYLFERTV